MKQLGNHIVMVSLIQFRNESLAPELLDAQLKTPSQYRFTIPLLLFLCIPILVASGHLSKRSTEIVTFRKSPKNLFPS